MSESDEPTSVDPMTIVRLLTVLVFFGMAAFAQIEQPHPELCGRDESTSPLLPPISVVIDKTQGSAKLIFDGAGFAKAIELPGVIDAVSEVCPVSSGRYVIFGETYNGTNVLIVDPKTRAVVDHFQGFDPVMSPDQRWIVYRKFSPREHELPVSEEYLLYDFSKTPAGNRSPGVGIDNWEDVGRAIFPVGRQNTMADHIDRPGDQLHSSGSVSFYWSADSHLVLFGDTLLNQFSIVAVKLGAGGSSMAYVHPVKVVDVCADKPAQYSFDLVMSSGTFTSVVADEYSLVAGFQPSPGICVPNTVHLQWPQDFIEAKPEKPVERQYRRKPAVVDQ